MAESFYCLDEGYSLAKISMRPFPQLKMAEFTFPLTGIILSRRITIVVLSVSPRNLKVKKADHILKTDVLSMKAKTGILTHKVKIKTKDNRKFNFDLYKVVAGESKWQKKAFERLQTFVPG